MSFGPYQWLLFAALSVATTASLDAQALGSRHTGPIVEGFGSVYKVAGLDITPATDIGYRAVFDVALGADENSQVNARIETLARFLNMHGQAGVPARNMQLALVLHGSAGKDALNDASYTARFGIPNPNRPLLEALSNAGVDIYLCGQTAMHRGLPKDQLLGPVKLALSAMTMLVTLQADGYSLIAF